MNLYFRLFWLILLLSFSKKQHPLEQTHRFFRVWPLDLDLNIHVNNGRYLTLMDLGRLDLMVKVNLFKRALKKGWMPVLGSAKIDYIRPLNLFQRFKLTTQVVYWDEKWIYLQQQFVYKDKLMATAFVKALFLKKKQKITPDEVMNELDHDIIRPTPPPALMTWLEAKV